MTSQGPQLTPPGGVHLLRLPGGARLGEEASARASAGQLALSPFAGPGPGLVMPTAPVQSGPNAFYEAGTVLHQAPSAAPASGDGDWAMPVVALVIITAGLAWRIRRRDVHAGHHPPVKSRPTWAHP